MERYVPICFVIAACLVAVAGIVAFDRSEELRARRAATFAPVVVVEPLSSTQYSGALRLRSIVSPERLVTVPSDGEAASPQLTAAFFDHVFPTPRAGG
jgi:hypothetical protein